MGAFLGTARQWQLFNRKLKHLQEGFGFKIFHAKDFKAQTKEFKGWSDTKCLGLVNRLTTLVSQNLTDGVTIHLEHDRYINEYRAPPIPKKMHLDSQYGVCFRACMQHLINVIVANNGHHKMHVVIEGGHANVYDAERIFNDIRTILKRRDIDLLGTFTVAKKEEAPPLMAADFLAHTYSMMRKSGSADDPPPDLQQYDIPPRGRIAGLTSIGLRPESLRELKENFEKERRRGIEKWRAHRDAKKAASKISSERQDS